MPNETDYPVQLTRISGRVWNITDTVYSDIEILMNSGFFDGMSADEISKELVQYLQDPQILSIEQIEQLELDGRMSKYQADKLKKNMYRTLPRGVYRSAKANAFRLAANETNIAYHRRDYDNRKKLPFVIGINVVLSGEHAARMPHGDMCDDLQGKYPPDFKFTGWHVRCLCHTTSILASDKEIGAYFRDEDVKFSNRTPFPNSPKKWIKDNKVRLNKAKSKPFWLKENGIKIE